MDVMVDINGRTYRIKITVRWVPVGNGKIEYIYYIPLLNIESPYPSETIEGAILSATVILAALEALPVSK